MVGNAHIDPMWIWDWDEGMHEVLQTFRAAVERLEEDPDLRFTASSAAYYRWVEETAPELFARIADLVRGGRWVVAGGQWVEPDCNLPSGESVCRQLLYGQRYLSEHLGVTATVGYNVDSFGHAGTLPQLLSAAGIRSYVFMRPGPEEKELPSPAFVWRGTDGTEILAYRIPFDYSTRGGPEDEILRTRAEDLLADAGSRGIPLMGFFGVGDHGGGPTRLAMRTVHALHAEHGGAVGFGDPAAYFEALAAATAVDGAALPVIDGELQWHAVGCYSARAKLKLANARAEDVLVAAETLNEMCRLLTGSAPDERHELAEAWQGVLFAQFHDALGGTCTDRATRAVEEWLVSARARGETVAVRAAHRVAEHVDTWVEGAEGAEGIESATSGLPVPLLVFNPLSWEATATVTVPHPFAAATGPDGRQVRVQQVASGEVTYSPTASLLRVPAPGFGYRRYWLHLAEPHEWRPGAGAAAASVAGAPAQAAASMAQARDDGVLTNGLVRARVDPRSGRLASLVALDPEVAGAGELLAEGVRPVVVDDDSDTWSHGVDRFAGVTEEGRLVSVTTPERGPVRATVRSVWSFGTGATTVAMEVSVYEGAPFVEVRLDTDWHEAHRVLKLVVPTALDSPTSEAGAPYGSVPRPCSGHEEPMVHWVDLCDPLAGWGLACTADGSGGYDASGPTLRLTVLRSPRAADHGMGWGTGDVAGYPLTDQGRHRARYRLIAHRGGTSEARVPVLAAEHRLEPVAVLDTWHGGTLGAEGVAMTVSGDSAVASVLKPGQDGGGSVVRLWEIAGRPSRALLAAGGGVWEGQLRPHEVRTLYVPDGDAGAARAIDVAELGGHGGGRRAPILEEPIQGLPPGLLGRHPELAPIAPQTGQALELLVRTIDGGGTIYVGGNGGSAADAEHIVGELMKGMVHRRPLRASQRAALERAAPTDRAADAAYLAAHLEGAVRAVCLTSQSGLLSAIANDTAGDMGMAQQLHGYGRPGDLFWALSTSGTSRNVVLGALAARAAGMRVLAFTGQGGGSLHALADVWVGVPATDVARVQELHQPLYHALCAAIEERYWPLGT